MSITAWNIFPYLPGSWYIKHKHKHHGATKSYYAEKNRCKMRPIYGVPKQNQPLQHQEEELLKLQTAPRKEANHHHGRRDHGLVRTMFQTLMVIHLLINSPFACCIRANTDSGKSTHGKSGNKEMAPKPLPAVSARTCRLTGQGGARSWIFRQTVMARLIGVIRART